jgi:hypothetical protein
MTKHDPRVGLYVPLRLFVQELAPARVLATYDLPSAALGQFGARRRAGRGNYCPWNNEKVEAVRDPPELDLSLLQRMHGSLGNSCLFKIMRLTPRWFSLALASSMAVACSVYDATLLAGDVIPGEASDAGRNDDGSGSAVVGTTSAGPTTITTSATVGMSGVTGGWGGATGGSGGATMATTGTTSGSTGAGGSAIGSGGATTGSTAATGGGPPTTTGTGGQAGGSGAGGATMDAGVKVDAGCPSATLCAVQAALIHRYSFQGSGGTVIDSVGGAHGTVVNGSLTGDGYALFGDGVDQYVDLPNGIIKPLTNATLETWVCWDGGGAWQRLFDFGSSDAGEGVRGFAVTSLYLTPRAGSGLTTMIVGLKRADQTSQFETRVISNLPLVSGFTTHLAIVINAASGTMTVYRNGAVDGSTALQTPLSALSDVNNWLGRSQYASDPAFEGAFDEFRIYRAALTNAQVQASFAAGPNPAFLK